MSGRWILVMGAWVVLVPACSHEQAAKDERIRSYIRDVTGDDLKVPGRLLVSTNDVTTDGRIAKVRGTVQNKFDETVHGVRYVVAIYENGSPPRILDRWQHEVSTTIEPGRRVALRLDVESMYFGRLGASPFNIDAQPVKLGDKEMPPPEGWR
jgi:hypothetical protein